MRFLLFLIIILSPSTLHAQNPIENYNGNNWNKFPYEWKVFYMTGFIVGTHNALKNSLDMIDTELVTNPLINKFKLENQNNPDLNKQEALLLEPLSNVSKKLESYFSNRLWLGGITVGQYQEGLDKFYSDFKNRNIYIRDLIYVIKNQIKGAGENEINAILEYLRGDKKDIKKLMYVNNLGKTEFAKFP